MRIEEVRSGLVARLLVRKGEIEQAAHTRIQGLSDPVEAQDPVYVEGLRAALTAAIDYGIENLERSEDRALPIPAAIRSQARMAAHTGVGIDTVLRRYFAGYTLFADFVIEEAEQISLHGAALKRLLAVQATLFDRVIAAVTEEYGRGAEGRLDSSEQRRTDRIRRLIAGDRLDITDFDYDFDYVHLGVVAAGEQAGEAIHEFARDLDCRLLLVRPRERVVWAWLGTKHELAPGEVETCLSSERFENLCLAVGEPAQGLAGWRITHLQATAAMPIALRGHSRVRYGDVALLSSIYKDDLLTASLRRHYLEPLRRDRDGGDAVRETLRAYFDAGRNVSSAAAAMELNRNTVSNRLRAVERRLGRPLIDCGAELEVAMRLDEFESP